jgi:hypothetical protein
VSFYIPITRSLVSLSLSSHSSVYESFHHTVFSILYQTGHYAQPIHTPLAGQSTVPSAARESIASHHSKRPFLLKPSFNIILRFSTINPTHVPRICNTRSTHVSHSSSIRLSTYPRRRRSRLFQPFVISRELTDETSTLGLYAITLFFCGTANQSLHLQCNTTPRTDLERSSQELEFDDGHGSWRR